MQRHESYLKYKYDFAENPTVVNLNVLEKEFCIVYIFNTRAFANTDRLYMYSL